MSEQTLETVELPLREARWLDEILGLLGMHEEGDPVVRVRELLDHEIAWVRRSAPVAQPVAWIPVTERLPEPNTWVLVNNGKWTGVGKHCPDCNEEVERWQSETTEFIELIGPKVIYWMPLPTEPKDKP